MTENNYTFFAHKPSSSDYCRGCHMQDYWEDTVFEFEVSQDEVIELWARCLLTNMNLSINEKGYYQIIVLKDGRLVVDDFDDRKKMENEAIKLASLWDRETKEREEQKKKAAKEKSDKEGEEMQRVFYEALKKKFEPQP